MEARLLMETDSENGVTTMTFVMSRQRHIGHNGCAENFMKNLGKIIQASNTMNNDFREELQKFLRSYRSTPHTSTNVAPADLIFRSSNLVRLPRMKKVDQEEKEVKARASDKKSKEKMKEYGDARRRACDAGLQVGDSVLLTRSLNVKVRNKGRSFYLPEPCTVIKVSKSVITARCSDGKIITRNAAVFKKNTAIRNREEFDPNEEIAASSAAEAVATAAVEDLEKSLPASTDLESSSKAPEATPVDKTGRKEVLRLPLPTDMQQGQLDQNQGSDRAKEVPIQRPQRICHPASKYDARSGTWSKT